MRVAGTAAGDDNVGTKEVATWQPKTQAVSGRPAAHRRDRGKRGREPEEVRERQEKLSDDVDAILDEINEVLEENAEEFVRSYVQKGGQ